MEAIIDLLINSISTLVTSIANLVTTQNTTNQGLQVVAQTLAAPTPINVTTTSIQSSIKPEPPGNYDGNPNRVSSFINELKAYFYMANITDLEKQIFLAISKICGGKNDQAMAWFDSIRDNIMEWKEEITWITALRQTDPTIVIPRPIYTTWE